VARDELERGGTGPAPWREVFQGARGRLTIGLLLLEALVAVEALVVTTIMPAVRADLHGIHLYGWAFTAFSLATFATIPIAGRAADRYGTARPLAVMLGIYLLGLVISGMAPTMPVLIAGRFVQGCGAGALYSISLGTVASAYPERLRPRVLALLATMWILPGLFGPPVGALIASTIGWRWAFVAPVPVLIVAAVLLFPALGAAAGTERDDVRLPVRAPLQLMIGAALFLGGLADLRLWSVPLLLAGALIAVPALVRIVPSGTLSARRGLPAAAAAAFLLSAAFFAVDAFVPLMLTSVRHLTVAEAGIVITLATITWSIGSWWQSQRAGTVSLGRLVTIGVAFVALGIICVTAGLFDRVSIIVPYTGWALAGLGMGIAFPTIPLSVMNAAAESERAGQLSSTLLMDTLGMAIGTGLAQSCLNLLRPGSGLRIGLVGAFGVGLVATAALLVLARRIPSGIGREQPRS
jgi:MFS family permease